MWETLRKFYARFKDVLDTVSDVTHEGEEGYKSLNDCYMRRLFCRPEVRVAFRLYVSVTFSNTDPTDLGSRFGMKCCTGVHDESCVEKWTSLKFYLHEVMLKRLGLNAHPILDDDLEIKCKTISPLG